MDHRERATLLLKTHGGVLVRKKRHEVWRFPDGRIWTRPSTPGTDHSNVNNLSQLKREFGFAEERQKKNSERRDKQPDHGGNGKKRRFGAWPQSSPMADQLRIIGLSEAAWAERVAELETQLDETQFVLTHRIQELEKSLQESSSRASMYESLYRNLQAEVEKSVFARIKSFFRR